MTRPELLQFMRRHKLAVQASVSASGSPQAAVVGIVVTDDLEIFFDTLDRSRKAQNLRARPRCSVATDDAYRPVVLEGDARVVTDAARRKNALDLENAKYGTDYGMEMLDPDHIAWFEIRPVWAFALDEDDFTGSPTRWSFVGDADA